MPDAPDRWVSIQTLFEQACKRPADERIAWLRSVCGDESEVYDHVVAMLDGADNEHAVFGARALDLIPVDALDGALTRAGEQIGPWVLGERIGTGGMGDVYRAERDSDFAQTAALKLVKRGMDSDAVLARFRAERRILARLDHPGIARVLDGGRADDGRPYFGWSTSRAYRSPTTPTATD